MDCCNMPGCNRVRAPELLVCANHRADAKKLPGAGLAPVEVKLKPEAVAKAAALSKKAPPDAPKSAPASEKPEGVTSTQPAEPSDPVRNKGGRPKGSMKGTVPGAEAWCARQGASWFSISELAEGVPLSMAQAKYALRVLSQRGAITSMGVTSQVKYRYVGGQPAAPGTNLQLLLARRDSLLAELAQVEQQLVEAVKAEREQLAAKLTQLDGVAAQLKPAPAVTAEPPRPLRDPPATGG